MNDRPIPKHWLPIDHNYSTVCGERSRRMFERLDFDKGWWIDGVPDCDYLHVETKPEFDGCVYRVRCRYYPGEKLNGKVIRSIGVGSMSGKLFWIIRIVE